jgi:hypothetical protein
VDEIIERLLDVRNGRPGKQVQLAENEIRLLCLTAKEIFMSQPNLLELEAPIKICGTFSAPCSRGCDKNAGSCRRVVRQVTSMGSTPTCCGCLSTAGSHQKPTTCSWETTWTAGSRA